MVSESVNETLRWNNTRQRMERAQDMGFLPLPLLGGLTGDVTVAPGPGVQTATITPGVVVDAMRTNGGSPTTGSVNLVAGSNITLTPSGQNITIAATGGGPTPIAVLSGPTISMSGTQPVSVAGLLTTSTILAVSQQIVGASTTLSLLGFSNTTNGFLNVQYVADPGAGGKVLVYFIP